MYRSKRGGAERMKLDGVPNAKGDRTEILKGEGKRYSRCGYFYRSWFVTGPGKLISCKR